MSQCLRCSKPREAASVFCESCRSLLRSQLGQSADIVKEETLKLSPVIAVPPKHVEVSDDPLERITGPQPAVPQSQPERLDTPPSEAPIAPEEYGNEYVVEHTVKSLTEAARRIAEIEQGNRRMLHASRLSPIRDISADIQRNSTPLPQISKKSSAEQEKELGKHIPDHWPWLQPDGDSDESEDDTWSNRTDPLMARHFPNSAEIARIEEDDWRRAVAEGLVTLPLTPQLVKRAKHPRMHMTFVVLVILAIIAFVTDGALISVAFLHPRHSVNVSNGPPSLTLSSNVARIGQTVMLHIHHFSSFTHVYLTHDIQESVQLTGGSALIKIDSNGSADVNMLVDATWTPGYHTIEAEDISTRYTASATLQIIGAGPTRPSHLLIDTTSLDFGADYLGANTIQSLTLHNSGGGSISWAANSDQPWLLLSPPQGMFSASQTIAVAVERANLKPGDYKGTITFTSNIGEAQWVHVTMTVRPLPANPGPVLEVIPPVLSFTALDGEADPPAQVLTVSNPGTQPLDWSITANNALPVASQSLLPIMFDASSNWLSTDVSSGVVVPRSSSLLHLIVHSRALLPGVYTNVLSISAGHGVYNSPQTISVSLTILPRCGLTLSAGSMSFTAVLGQSNPSYQSLSLSANSSCSGTVNWKALSAANWLSLTPLSLNFSTTQGLPNPPGQVVTITNTGKSQLSWHTTVNIMTSWLAASPTGGSIAPGQTGQVTISIYTANLTPNTYVGQVVFVGADSNGAPAAGSPQTITVNLLVLPPCTLQPPSLSSLAFSATQGSSNPGPQSVSITGTGNCAWPLSWHTTLTNPASWLALAPASGSLVASGQSVPITVSVNTAGLNAGTYSTRVLLSATDGSNTAAQGSPRFFTVTLTVLQPCQLQVGPPNLMLSGIQGQSSSSTQNLSLSETGACALPVTWQAQGDSGSSGWLVLGPPASGTGSATVPVGVNPRNLSPGIYSGTITVSAFGNGGAIVQNSPQTVNVTLTVTGYTFSGSVIACSDSNCTSSKRLPGSSLNLLNNSTNQTIIVTADGSGNFSFANLARDSYTLTVNGTDGIIKYLGTVSFNLTGDKLSFPAN